MVDAICYRVAKGELSKNIYPLVPKKESDFCKSIFRTIKIPEIYNKYNYPSGFFWILLYIIFSKFRL